MLVYRLPRTPSTPRINLWRQLRRLGVAQVVDSVVALPTGQRKRAEQLEWLAEEVVEAGGDATIWVSQTATAAQERRARRRDGRACRRGVSSHHRRCAGCGRQGGEVGGGVRWRGSAASCAGSDRGTPPPPPERDGARAAVERLAGALSVGGGAGIRWATRRH